MKQVKIACRGAIELDISEIEAFQGNLKDLSKENYNKLRKQILDLGFSEPASVWQSKDGKWKAINCHQRLRVLTELRNSEGYHIPPIPCSIVEAENEHEAKRKVLSLTSQFGEITNEGLFEFITRAKIDLPTLEGFRFPEVDILKFKQSFFEDQPQEVLEKVESIKCPACGK